MNYLGPEIPKDVYEAGLKARQAEAVEDTIVEILDTGDTTRYHDLLSDIDRILAENSVDSASKERAEEFKNTFGELGPAVLEFWHLHAHRREGPVGQPNQVS